MRVVSSETPSPREHHLFEDAPGPWLAEQSDEVLQEWVDFYEKQQSRKPPAERDKRPRHLTVVK